MSASVRQVSCRLWERALDSWEQLRSPHRVSRGLHADRCNVAASLTLVHAACAQMSLRALLLPDDLRSLSARALAKNNPQLWVFLFNWLDLQLPDALVVEWLQNDCVL